MTSTQPSIVRGESVVRVASWQLVQTATKTAFPGASGSLSGDACPPTAFAAESAKQMTAIGSNSVARRSVFIGTHDNARRAMTRITAGLVVGAAGCAVLLLTAAVGTSEGTFAALPATQETPRDNPSTPARVALGRILFWDPILSG